MKKYFEILVPTLYGESTEEKPKRISTKHHKEWDKLIKKIAGGLTIMTPAKGMWVHEGKDFNEKVIPVRIICTEEQMLKIVDITLRHYRQIAVVHCKLSEEVKMTYADSRLE